MADGLIVIWVAGLVRAVDTKTSPNWFLLPAMALWANVHGGFIVGLALAAGLAAEAIIEGPSGERRSLARRWTVFLLAAVAASCLTPYGWGPLLLTLKGFILGNEVKQYIQEWQPVSLAVGANYSDFCSVNDVCSSFDRGKDKAGQACFGDCHNRYYVELCEIRRPL